jgi:hypothetical protein
MDSVLDLHSDFYPRDAIERTKGAFAGVVEVTLEQHDSYHRVHIQARRGVDIEDVRHQFANYVLAVAATGSAPRP